MLFSAVTETADENSESEDCGIGWRMAEQEERRSEAATSKEILTSIFFIIKFSSVVNAARHVLK